jgi:hypothetical protein
MVLYSHVSHATDSISAEQGTVLRSVDSVAALSAWRAYAPMRRATTGGKILQREVNEASALLYLSFV